MSTLIKCHNIIFTELFDKCSNGKEKYLRFQIEWYKYCSVLLLSQEHKVESVIPKYDGKGSLISFKEVAKFHTEMHRACYDHAPLSHL